MAYIYKITNDVNQKIYIGKTEFSIEKRFKEHCRDCKRERLEKRPLYVAMREYGIEHFHIELIEETNEPEKREKYWIKYYHSYIGDEKCNGYNATLGGDGKKYIDYDLVVETYKKVKNVTETAKLLNISPDSVSNILHIKNVQVLSSSIVVQEKYGKRVAQIDLTTNTVVQIFNSYAEADKYFNDGDRRHIGDVCNGKRKTAHGYGWERI